VDRQVRYLFFNETHREMMEEFWGCPPRQGNRVLELVEEPSYREQARALYRRALRGETISLETTLSDPASRERSFHYVLTPLCDKGSDEVRGVLVVSVETTIVRQQREALREAALDRELLIHKLDHQVKNTIQSVISTLTREMEELPKEGSPRLERGIRRLITLSNLYDTTITGDRLAFASLPEHLGEVITTIVADRERPTVSVTRRMESISMATTSVLPLCQLTGELLSSMLDQLASEDGAHLLVTLENRGKGEAEIAMVATHRHRHGMRSSTFVTRLLEELDACLEQREGPPETIFRLRFRY
jgi:two-component sensor histidine kinase